MCVCVCSAGDNSVRTRPVTSGTDIESDMHACMQAGRQSRLGLPRL